MNMANFVQNKMSSVDEPYIYTSQNAKKYEIMSINALRTLYPLTYL